MKTVRMTMWLCCVASLACVALGSPAQAASTRNYLTVEGRVLDHLGTPLPGTWVFCLGSRRASVPVDSLGNYRLEIPGATLEELGRSPLKIRIQARRKGYRFALANGAPELGLEMRVIKDDSPLSRLRVRSNDSSSVSAVANSVVLDANPRALLSAQFVGSPGAQYDTPPVPLEESDEITLAGEAQSIPELAAAPALPPATAIAVPVTPPAKSAPPKESPAAKMVPAPVEPPSVASSAPPATVGSNAPAPRKWNAGGGDHEASKPRVVRPGLDPNAASEPPAKPKGKQKEKPALTATLTEAPLAGEHQEPAAPATKAAETAAATPPPAATPLPAQAQPQEPPRRSAPESGLKPVLPKDTPVARVSPGAQQPIQRVPSAPGVGPSGPRRVPGSEAENRTPMCDCTIRGTVEVQWDRPLTSRTEVVISVEDTPDIATSVELFMGSPRAFEIHPAPCGVHRLLLWTRSKQRFVLVSSEPRVVCTPGGVQQMRLVLEPVARWGASQ